MKNDKMIGGVFLELDENRVYCPGTKVSFNYSDGLDTELYLERVFKNCSDLSSESYQLEGYIKDWTTEYHLTRKRSQLLSAFSFNKNSRVLEVGCGCGAISRILGETFDEVVSVEGSYNRAKLARMRCRDLNNVSIVCSPYQDLSFNGEFDYVFCIGVLEYAGYLVGGNDPYESAIASFKRALRPGGVLVVAIENQYGLKYFSNATEDHTNMMFEGIQGYPQYSDSVKTFGMNELNNRLSKHFPKTDFFFPYPDYKIPDAVLSDYFLNHAEPAELIGGLKPRDYTRDRGELFSQELALYDLSKNKQLSFFSNSFLVFSGRDNLPKLNDAEGVLFSSGRLPEFSTITYFQLIDNVLGASFKTKKELRYQFTRNENIKEFSLNCCQSPWYAGKSLQALLISELVKKNISWENVGELVRQWVITLEQVAVYENDIVKLPGNYLDATWKNCFIDQEVAKFIDLEWSNNDSIDLSIVFLRSCGLLIHNLIGMKVGRLLFLRMSSVEFIEKIANVSGIKLRKNAIDEYIRFECDFQLAVTDKSRFWLKVIISKSILYPYYVWCARRTISYFHHLKALQKRAVRYFIRRLI